MIAVLGANDFDALSADARHAYLGAVERIALARVPIRTGASRGCDQIATETALALGGRVELVLPWSKWESEWVTRIRENYPTRVSVDVFNPIQHQRWAASVQKWALRDEKMTPNRFREYARVYGIVTPCEIVLAMTLNSERGGTGQGMRIARTQGKVVLDVRHEADRRRLQEWLLGLPHC